MIVKKYSVVYIFWINIFKLVQIFKIDYLNDILWCWSVTVAAVTGGDVLVPPVLEEPASPEESILSFSRYSDGGAYSGVDSDMARMENLLDQWTLELKRNVLVKFL